jgi:hypothetical protein
MKAYKVELLVIDHDGLGPEGIKGVLENMDPNHCMYPKAVDIEEREIGEWHDKHPLNMPDQWMAAYDGLFNIEVAPRSDASYMVPHDDGPIIARSILEDLT